MRGNHMPNTGSNVVTNRMSTSQPGRREEPSDEAVEAFIATHPGGASLEEIGAVLGMTRNRVGQIVSDALEKALRIARRRGLEAHDFPTTETLWDRMERG